MAFTEKLIELVKIYPILYDLSYEDYKNVRKKDKVWEQIDVELKESGKWFYLLRIKKLTNFSRLLNTKFVARFGSVSMWVNALCRLGWSGG